MSNFLNLFFTFSLIKFRKEKEKREKWIKLFPSQYPSVMKKNGEKKEKGFSKARIWKGRQAEKRKREMQEER